MTTGRRQLTGSSGWVIAALLALAAFVSPVIAGEAGPADTKVQAERVRFFEQRIRPLLVEKCNACHGAEKQKGSLRLDSLEAMLKGGESGPAVVPGKPGESLLVEAVNYEGLEMPPSGKLEPDKIEVLTRWVAMGAPWPAAGTTGSTSTRQENKPLAATSTEDRFSDGDRAFWSFQPLRSPATASGFRRVQPQPRRALVRLVPEPDRSIHPQGPARKGADARARGRPADLDPPRDVRPDGAAADSRGGRRVPRRSSARRLRAAGRPLAGLAPVWPAMGRGTGSTWCATPNQTAIARTRFVPMPGVIATTWCGRSIPTSPTTASSPSNLPATSLTRTTPSCEWPPGYLRLGTYEFNQRNVRGQWADILNDITDVTGEVFLGLSIGCARCHDHKFDPILQKDYYRLQAFFTPLLPRDDLTLRHVRGQWADYQNRLAAWEKATAELRRQIAAIEQPYREKAARGAIAKFPDDIKAILSKPENGSDAAGEAAWRLWPTARSSLEHDQRAGRSRAGRRRDATS